MSDDIEGPPVEPKAGGSSTAPFADDPTLSDADKAILAETSLQEVERLDAEARAASEAHAKELQHAQELAVYAATHQAPLDPAALKARNRRNWAIAGVLVAFVVLVFISTLFHMSGGATPQPSHP
jgi:hypothetical protein